ncbi:MAG TPA: ABC transporter ATP-binding protein/permease [Gammaproteobacteria bacterium]|nr:ABC transporter ATP-binding protein/permease [Gammaproteobacteria bacterium]
MSETSGQALNRTPYTAWTLLKAYWQSSHRKSAYAFLGVVIVMSMVLVGMDVVFTNWYNHFYNALQDYDWRGALDLIFIFVFIAGVNIILAVYRYYLQSFLALRWRRWLTHQFIDRWLEKRGYYYLEDFNDSTDNPDQRIQEDINSLVNMSLSLLVGMLSAVVTIFAFVFVLWELSGTLTLPFGSFGTLHVPGYLVWVAIIYAILGTTATFKIGRPLIMLNFEQQRREANFRFAAIDLRSHAEHVALYRGEMHQKNSLNQIFGGVLDNWYAIILRQKLLLWFTAGYNQISVILPLVVALPNYFNKVFKLGGLIQTLSAFARIQEALSFIVNSYTTIAEWQAVMRRLLTFLNRVHEVEMDAEKNNHFSYSETPQNRIDVRDVTIFTPTHGKLLQNITEDFVHGRHYWIKGDSGIGKSTFVRVLAGIWPYGSGAITLPNHQRVMYIPQRSYMPLGTLKQALLFPDQVSPVSDDELKKLLCDCDLPNLASELQHVTVWSEHLSPGELQRIAFVRVLLTRPDWVFLDESTSALDLTHERQLYRLLKERLPNCSVVSIGHRPSLDEYHDHRVDFARYSVSRTD